MKKIIFQSLRTLFIMTVLTGVLYPLAVTLVGQGLFYKRANGSILQVGEQLIGSELLAQKFSLPQYFWPRPSNSDFQTLPTGASNLGPSSQKLKDRIGETQKIYGQEQVPYELLLSSGSGLDPHISPETAKFQMDRIAQARSLNPEILRKMVDEHSDEATWGILGRPRVNVLKLNLALDGLKK